jgi:sigma-B regulation protein RsbU (phosphoserine phosphatase)
VLLEAASSGARLEDWLPRLNRFLLERTAGEKYATLFACTVDAKGRVEYLNAGHSRPFLLRRSQLSGPELEVLEQDGFPVGLLEFAQYETATCHLHPGDTIVLFSDGVEEGRRGPHEFFGRERIAAAVVEHARENLQGLHDALREALTEFLDGAEPHDDATLLMVRYEG